MLDECGPDIANSQTEWSASAGDLVDIAVTLQRDPGTRACGLDLFEGLMDFDAYKVSDVLRDLDRRFPD